MTMAGAEAHINVQSQEEIDLFPILPQLIQTMVYV